MSAAELQDKRFPPVKYVVPGYISPGCVLLAGRPKVGKSWLVLDTAIAVALGSPCFTGETCEEGDVLALMLEDNERRLQSRITKLLGAFKTPWPPRLKFVTATPRANKGGLAFIHRWIKNAKAPRLVIVDVLAMFRAVRGNSQNPYDTDYEALSGLQKIASDTEIAVVAVHHLRKSPSDTDPFDKVSGTLGLSAAADTVLILDRDSNGTTLYGRGRDIEEIETAVEFDHRSGKWRVLGNAAEARRSDERSAIITALRESDGSMSPTELSNVTGQPDNNVRQLLRKMVEDGQISKRSRGRYELPRGADNNNNKVTLPEPIVSDGDLITDVIRHPPPSLAPADEDPWAIPEFLRRDQ